MKILQLSKKVPYPLKDGETLAIHYLSKGLVNNGAIVDLLAINTKKHQAHWTDLPSSLKHYNEVHKVDLDSSPRYGAALMNLFSSKSYNIERFRSEEFSSKLGNLLMNNTYDVIQIEGLYMAAYLEDIRQFSKALIVMRSHNLEFEIWENLSKEVSSPLKAWYFKECARKLRNFEKANIKKYDLILPITKEDEGKLAKFSSDLNSFVVPVGLDLAGYQDPNYQVDMANIQIGYLGSLDWIPNIEGVKWFLDKTWPIIEQKHPQLSFHLAGRGGVAKDWQYNFERFKYYGEVEDARSFLEKMDIVLVPLFSGSGMRVKIVESLAMSKVVLSTPKGFEGIPIKNGYDAYLFNDEHELLDVIGRLCIAKDLSYVKEKARKLALDKFEYNKVAQGLLDTYKDRLQNKNR